MLLGVLTAGVVDALVGAGQATELYKQAVSRIVCATSCW